MYKGKDNWKIKKIDLTKNIFFKPEMTLFLSLAPTDFRRPTSRVQPTDIKFGQHLNHLWRFACPNNTIKSGLGFFDF